MIKLYCDICEKECQDGRTRTRVHMVAMGKGHVPMVVTFQVEFGTYREGQTICQECAFEAYERAIQGQKAVLL